MNQRVELQLEVVPGMVMAEWVKMAEPASKGRIVESVFLLRDRDNVLSAVSL